MISATKVFTFYMILSAAIVVFLNSRSSELNHPLNICWIFEKEKRLLDDPTPQYEVHIMEYFHEIEVNYQTVTYKCTQVNLFIPFNDRNTFISFAAFLWRGQVSV